ncbi:hypothetical protein AVEN_182722-1 [Araneus ventricosus]|uniref:Secreted protein n=1 Tax=Araneus ventricosus TaxID=182803 RepID=A0A4Y2K1L3_ARAVE|nr:hypothetical protein AVEN_13340-1 [Araneus ventricosus]GBM95775.1 hypothetical protein AVEN_182722-1 [Araneus ventricosus]
MKNLLVVIGFWVTIGSNFFSRAGEGETAPFWGSIRESLGENTPAGLSCGVGRPTCGHHSVFPILGEFAPPKEVRIHLNLESRRFCSRARQKRNGLFGL